MGREQIFITFESLIIDEFEYSSSGDITIPGGLKLATLIAKVFENLGFDTSLPIQYQYYGWEVIAKNSGIKCWFLLQYPGPWLLIVENRTGFFSGINAKSFSFKGIVENLKNNLMLDTRFSNVKVFTKAEYESLTSKNSALLS
ncbi:hypothetical protein [Methylobacillus glycogenes]|uniref:hypothetical protein n=1 Tax=Methylobacillus glycogenes TaxID=406 RepID=UPI00046F42C9|nr:hypothetical protein [Methylobacillus glycogenes]